MVVRPNGHPPTGELDTAMETPFAYLTDYTKKKIRNLEKRKTKLESYKNKLKSGEKLSSDQYEAVKKFDEVAGMLSFANEIIAHVQLMDQLTQAEKAKRERLRVDQAESDKLEGLTRQIELYTLMHLTKDELVGTLREECSFLPSPGASLHHFAAGTAKHLINLTDPADKTDPINYQQVKEKLEEIEPQFNPVGEYEVPEYDEYEEEEEIDEPKEDSEPVEDIQLESEIAEPCASGDAAPTEDALPVDDDEDEEIDVVNGHYEVQEVPYNVNFQPPEQPQPTPTPPPPPQEEDQIAEILTEVTSQFTFLAPAASEDEPEDEEEPQLENNLNFMPAQVPEQPVEEEQEVIPPPAHALPTPPAPGFGYTNGLMMDPPTQQQPSAEPEVTAYAPAPPQPPTQQKEPVDSVKDELNWQQKATQQTKYSRNGPSSYKNSQRYQRQFNGQANGQANMNQRTNGDSRGGSRGYSGASRGYRRGAGGKPE